MYFSGLIWAAINKVNWRNVSPLAGMDEDIGIVLRKYVRESWRSKEMEKTYSGAVATKRRLCRFHMHAVY